MTYLPTEYIDSSFTYYSNGDYFIVVKPDDSCFNIYPKLDYLVSESYSCDISSLAELNYNIFTDVYSYRLDFVYICIMLFICIFGLLFVLKALCKNLFRGVFNS